MKTKFIYIFSNQIFFLIIIIKIIKTFQENNTYDKKCYEELSMEMNGTYGIIEHNKLYPWITDYMGKGLNDLGDELECLNSLLNTTFLIIKIKTIDFFFKNDTKLLDYLEVQDFSIGVCIMVSCNQTFHIYFQQFIEMMKNISIKDEKNKNNNMDNEEKNENEDKDKNIVEYIEFFNFSSKYK